MPQSTCLLVNKYRRNVVFGFFWLTLLQLVGCAAFRYAGGPPPSYNVDEDLRQLEKHFKPATAIEDYYSAPTPKKRNEVISARLVMINLEYLKWLRKISADKQFLDTATDVLVLSLNLTATVTGGETAKTILAAISAGVTGSKVSIDKHYYFEKTMPALIAEMNAGRKVVLEHILRNLSASLDDYSFEQALADIYDYYQAGTLTGAVMSIQAEAGAREKEADEKIQWLSKESPEEKEAVITVRKIIERIKSGELNDDEKKKVYSAMSSLGIQVQTENEAAMNLLRMLQRVRDVPAKTAVEIVKAFKLAGFPID